MSYEFLKTLHVIAAILLVGNITVTAVWKVMASRTGDPRIIAFGQRLVTLTDFWFTLPGAITLVATGDYIAYVLIGDSWSVAWIVWGRILFIASGLLWVLVLVPIQIRQGRLARGFAEGGDIPDSYWRLNFWWLAIGTVAVTLPLIVVVIMVLKPV